MTITLGARFAHDLPDLATPWRAEEQPDPRIVVLNEALAVELGLDPDWLRSEEGLGVLAGTAPPSGAQPVAQGYAGHQFGGFSPRLGDGRALLLGELRTPSGALRDLHLKGSGRTPYARAGDGRAVLGPMLREYVVSEALHALGIPTTRSLAVLSTGRAVMREHGPEPGGLLVRVAASHLRVGSFQYARLLDHQNGTRGTLTALGDHAIARHDRDLLDVGGPERYARFLGAVADRQAHLVARWMHVGFVHGVMNTDNMTISGESIDFGPCAFLDAHDPAAVFSSIDAQGRYRFGNQPGVAQWNLARFAEALVPLLSDVGEAGAEDASGAGVAGSGVTNDAATEAAIEVAQDVLGGFAPAYTSAWAEGLRAKLGLPLGVEEQVVVDLGHELLDLLAAERVDHTTAFRALTAGAAQTTRAQGTDARSGPIRDLVLDRPRLDTWLARWDSLEPDAAAMASANPLYIPRNHLLDEALRAATAGDVAPVERLLEAVTAPYDEREGFAAYAEPGPADFAASFRTFCGT